MREQSKPNLQQLGISMGRPTFEECTGDYTKIESRVSEFYIHQALDKWKNRAEWMRIALRNQLVMGIDEQRAKRVIHKMKLERNRLLRNKRKKKYELSRRHSS